MIIGHVQTGDGAIFMHTYGKAVRITAIATSADEANAYMARTPGAAAIMVLGDLVLIADEKDLGKPIA